MLACGSARGTGCRQIEAVMRQYCQEVHSETSHGGITLSGEITNTPYTLQRALSTNRPKAPRSSVSGRIQYNSSYGGFEVEMLLNRAYANKVILYFVSS